MCVCIYIYPLQPTYLLSAGLLLAFALLLSCQNPPFYFSSPLFPPPLPFPFLSSPLHSFTLLFFSSLFSSFVFPLRFPGITPCTRAVSYLFPVPSHPIPSVQLPT